MKRRTVLGLPALGLLAAAAAACAPTTGAPGQDGSVREPDAPGEGRIAYGEDPSQYGELYLPDASSGAPRGVVVVIHGGFWRAEYDASLGRPLAVSLAEEGWVAWNLEYRRLGNGGGTPATFDDVAAGIDALRDLRLGGVDLATAPVVTLGHSAGGHLAAWAAGRLRDERWAGGLPVTAVVSQAGVLDLRAAEEAGLGGGAAAALLGHAPTEADAAYDPAQQIPLEVPVWCVHGTSDTNVPLAQSGSYVARAQDAGAEATLVEVAGDHFVVIDPGSEAWAQTLAVLDEIG